MLTRRNPAAQLPAPNNNLRAPPNAAGRANQPANENLIPDENREHNPLKRANINIATLNMNGATAPTQRMTHIDKWTMVNSTIRTEKIAILALQETHLDGARLDDIKRCFGKSFDIFNSSEPDNPRGSAGVAFVINKALIAPNNVYTLQRHPRETTQTPAPRRDGIHSSRQTRNRRIQRNQGNHSHTVEKLKETNHSPEGTTVPI